MPRSVQRTQAGWPASHRLLALMQAAHDFWRGGGLCLSLAVRDGRGDDDVEEDEVEGAKEATEAMEAIVGDCRIGEASIVSRGDRSSSGNSGTGAIPVRASGCQYESNDLYPMTCVWRCGRLPSRGGNVGDAEAPQCGVAREL
jgi:hypothetical protein